LNVTDHYSVAAHWSGDFDEAALQRWAEDLRHQLSAPEVSLGLVFLISSATSKTKKIIYWAFGVLVVTHNLGLSFRSCGGVWGDILAVSGVGILLLVAYMWFVIFSDLIKSPVSQT
jgi:hypothetical protein